LLYGGQIVRLVDLLVSRGADVNVKDSQGMPALMLAAAIIAFANSILSRPDR
jgi:ankyrin repeat protein